MSLKFFTNQEKEVEKKIEAVINRLRPGFLENGGDLNFIKFKDGIVVVNFIGSFIGCSSNKRDVEQMIENELRKDIVEVQRVMQVERYMLDDDE